MNLNLHSNLISEVSASSPAAVLVVLVSVIIVALIVVLGKTSEYGAKSEA